MISGKYFSNIRLLPPPGHTRRLPPNTSGSPRYRWVAEVCIERICIDAHSSDKGFMPLPKKLSVSVSSTLRLPVEMVAITRTPGRSG
jgi:hypothetical protein